MEAQRKQEEKKPQEEQLSSGGTLSPGDVLKSSSSASASTASTHAKLSLVKVQVPIPHESPTRRESLSMLEQLLQSTTYVDTRMEVATSRSKDIEEIILVTSDQEDKLVDILEEHKEAIGWAIATLKGIDTSVCMHHIHCEIKAKPHRNMQ